jgi:hypothetical protein
METGALIWQIESEMLDNLLGLIMRGAVGSAEWQTKKLQELGLLREINAKTIKAHREEVAEAVRQELARRTGQKVAIVNNALGIAGYSVTADPRVSGILANYQNAVAVKMETIYSTMLRSAGEKYVETVQVATAKAQLGMSGRKAVAEIVKGWSDKGLPGFRDAAGREWTPEAYASVLTRTSGTQCATEGQLSRMDELGLDLVEVSSHVGARPGCAPYQGRIFYRNTPVEGYDSLYKDTTYGEPDGLFGINCRHVMYPYIPGTKETFKPYPEERNEAAYKNSQIQRKLERNIRGAKRELSNLQKTGVESEIQAAKEKVSRGQSAMRQFIDQSGRRRDYDREQIRG